MPSRGQGLYLVHARFDAADPATDLGFNAFMGRLVSAKPALVRVRHGELPFTPLEQRCCAFDVGE